MKDDIDTHLYYEGFTSEDLEMLSVNRYRCDEKFMKNWSE